MHVDVKKLGRIDAIGHRITGDRRQRGRGIGWEFVHVCIDDCSRLAYAEVLGDEQSVTVAGFLRRATRICFCVVIDSERQALGGREILISA